MSVLLFLGALESTPAYPPADCILLQRGDSVPLRWQLPGQSFELVVKPGVRQTLRESKFLLPVSPGGEYEWTVTSNLGAKLTRRFSVARDFEYHHDGLPGTGEPGGHIEARLERDGSGMNLFLRCGQDRLHYLFAEPDLRFLISARGADGRPGAPGMDVPNNPCRPGCPGGIGGWGGEVRIQTVSCPWRDYLTVDVSPGEGGPGGRGGRALFSHVAGYDSPRPIGPTGPPGASGRAGTIVTTIGQPR